MEHCLTLWDLFLFFFLIFLKGCEAEKGMKSPGNSQAHVTSVPSAATNHYQCSICQEKFNFSTAVEKLRHRRQCEKGSRDEK